MKEGGDVLYLNSGNGYFRHVTGAARIGSEKGGNKALFFDLDHDGDLDLYEMTSDKNLQFRNNADGTFTDQSEKMGASKGGSTSVTAGDYNNDGFLDLFITSLNPGGHELFRNNGKGFFEPEKNMKEMFGSLQHVKAYDASFLDFNNDGFLDLLIAGEASEKGGRGLLLYYNNGKGNFTDVSDLLPAELKSGRQIAVFDYNDDGDLDIVIAGLNGRISRSPSS